MDASPDLPDAYDDVTLTVPADPAFVSLIRTASAALGARLDIGIDRLDDLRLAVDEACALLLQHAAPGSALQCRFRLLHGASRLSLEARTASSGRPLRTGGFVWTVLTALVDDVTVVEQDGDVVVALSLGTDGKP